MKENNTSRNNGSTALVKQIRNTLEDMGRLTDDAKKSERIQNIWSSAHVFITTVSAIRYSYLMCPKPLVNQYQVLISKVAHASLITCAT
ncbi:MAG: hypothetical protein L6265_04180 [Thermoplasmatales archaeon]|nr:hypothetical protein [Thermoplasmatales archaeon]